MMNCQRAITATQTTTEEFQKLLLKMASIKLKNLKFTTIDKLSIYLFTEPRIILVLLRMTFKVKEV